MSELTRERNREGGDGWCGRGGIEKERVQSGPFFFFRGNQKKEDETDILSPFHLVQKESGRGQLFMFS